MNIFGLTRIIIVIQEYYYSFKNIDIPTRIILIFKSITHSYYVTYLSIGEFTI
jgi:hypothetical protein